MAFSLTEKLAVAGAFLALVALAVGTENDPGVIAKSQEETARAAASAPDASPQTHAPGYSSMPGDAQPRQPAPVLAAPDAPPENLPPGFGAAPPPDLEK